MIHESYYWKKRLLNFAKKLESRLLQKRWSKQSFAKLEEELFLGFYIIRKLLEAKKLSSNVENKEVQITYYNRLDSTIDIMNWHHIERHFDIENSNEKAIKLRDFCNLFIHSFVFAPGFEEHYLHFVLVTSDWFKMHCCYKLDIQDITKIFYLVGNNYPHSVQLQRNSKGEMQIAHAE